MVAKVRGMARWRGHALPGALAGPHARRRRVTARGLSWFTESTMPWLAVRVAVRVAGTLATAHPSSTHRCRRPPPPAMPPATPLPPSAARRRSRLPPCPRHAAAGARRCSVTSFLPAASVRSGRLPASADFPRGRASTGAEGRDGRFAARCRGNAASHGPTGRWVLLCPTRLPGPRFSGTTVMGLPAGTARLKRQVSIAMELSARTACA